MDKEIAKKYQLCPVIFYGGFCTTEDENGNLTKVDKFKNDMSMLLSAGYQSISLSKIEECRRKQIALPENAFCILFHGGYNNHYTLAFPIIKQLGIHADAFLATDLVGMTTYPGIQNFCPHYGWEEVNEMHSSGLVDFYALWHPFDQKKDSKETVVREKIDLINAKIKNGCAGTAFYFGANTNEEIQILQKLNIPLYLGSFLSTTPTRMHSGFVPYIETNQDSDIFDVIDTYYETCTSLIKREESVRTQNDQAFVWTQSQDWHSVSLPIEETPLIRNYLRHAIPLSVLAADRKEKAELVVLNSYIDVVFRPWYHWFDYDNHLYDAWNCITCCRINREMAIATKINMVDVVLQGLNAGYYSDLWLDTYYIPGKPGYGTKHLSHWLLIYGYVQETHSFCALSYTNNGHYDHLDVQANDLLKACSNDYFLWLNLLKVNKSERVIYNKNFLVRKLREYIQSEYNAMDYTKYNTYDNNQLCNWEACKAFPNYLLSTGEKEKKIYIVTLYSFLEHKKCMGWRLAYIASRENIRDKAFQAFAKYTEQQYKILLVLGIKYSITQDEKILHRIVDQCTKLVEKERENILRLLDYVGG